MKMKVINDIREYYRLFDDITDEQIARDLKGSLGETVVNINLAMNDLKKTFQKVLPNIIKRYLGR